MENMAELKNKTILITGGAGFIGGHLVDALIKQGNKVIVIDNLSSGRKENINLEAKFYKADVRSEKITEIFTNILVFRKISASLTHEPESSFT